MNKIKIYFKSFYTKLSIFLGIFMYFCYGHGMWDNPQLIGVSIFVTVFLPYYTKISDKFEEIAAKLSGMVIIGKLGRFVSQLPVSWAIMYTYLKGNVINLSDLHAIGGAFGVAAITTITSQGLQYLAIVLSNRDIGDRFLNVTIALFTNVFVTAMAALGIPWFQLVFKVFGILFGFIGFVYALCTDIMASFVPKGGIGIFLGTFNPVHQTHMSMVKKFIEDRQLEKVYIHPVAVHKLYARFLREGAIRIAKWKDGMRVYDRTESSDFHMNYFPYGCMFYEAESRVAMLRASIKDNKLEDKVQVIYYPEVFEKDGFYGIIKIIKAKHKGQRLHGLHGSDLGGMQARAIYDESLRIWPYTVVRKDNVSATAIRQGATGMTSETVTRIINLLRDSAEDGNGTVHTILDRHYIYRDNRLIPLKDGEAGDGPRNIEYALHIPIMDSNSTEVI